LALIGVGGIAQSAHLPAYRKGQQIGLPIEVVAAADVDEGQRERARRLWGIPAVYADFREMLERECPDVVDITLHWERHADAKLAAVQTAAEYGCHILLQKPMAATWEQCVAMVEAAKRSGVLLAVNQNARFAPTFLLHAASWKREQSASPSLCCFVPIFPTAILRWCTISVSTRWICCDG
jgi:Predicted dehydrogenases and related proteins